MRQYLYSYPYFNSVLLIRHVLYYDFAAGVIIFHHQRGDSGNCSPRVNHLTLNFLIATTYIRKSTNPAGGAIRGKKWTQAQLLEAAATCQAKHLGAMATGQVPICLPSYGLSTGRRWTPRTWSLWEVCNNPFLIKVCVSVLYNCKVSCKFAFQYEAEKP